MSDINMNQTYQQMVDTLIKKYGPVNGDYFCKSTCKSKNNKITRGSEGLYVHHIKEDTVIDLCQTQQALLHPWEYQQAQNLVYANIWEHFQLHCKIMQENADKDQNELVGFGGVFIFISSQIIDSFITKNPKRVDVKKSKEIMSQHKEDFIELYSDMIAWCLTTHSIQAQKFMILLERDLKVSDFKSWAIHRSAIKEMFDKKGVKYPPSWFTKPFNEITTQIEEKVNKKQAK